MLEAARRPRLFLGSSREGLDVAQNLQVELGDACEVERWDHDVFKPSGCTLPSLLSIAESVDFAVLVATPDDTVVSRGEEHPSARDNIVLEFGLFAGALGLDRTFLLATGELKLPTDVLGLTRLRYQRQSSQRASVTAAALQVAERIRSLGLHDRSVALGSVGPQHAGLARELNLLCDNAEAQGWTVRKNDTTTLRLRSPKGVTFTLSKTLPGPTREELRPFVARLRSAGLRVNTSLRRPPDESPW